MNGTNLRQGLLAAESASPELERRYRERLRGIAERRLTGIDRASHVFGLVIGVALTARFVQLLLERDAATRPVTWAGLAVGLAFSAGWAVAAASVLRSGVDRFFTHASVRAGLVVTFTFLLAGLMLWAGLDERDPAAGVRLILFGLVFWCAIGLPFLVAHLIRQAELRLRADSLRVELALARQARATAERP